jgi:hypothetical protein
MTHHNYSCHLKMVMPETTMEVMHKDSSGAHPTWVFG